MSAHMVSAVPFIPTGWRTACVHCGILPEQALQGVQAEESLRKQSWDIVTQVVSQMRRFFESD